MVYPSLMRKYTPIWEAVKKESKVSVSADVSAHPRIVNGVRKEKNKDYGWKLLTGEEGKKFELHDKSEGSLLTFYLVDVSPLSINDL